MQSFPCVCKQSLRQIKMAVVISGQGKWEEVRAQGEMVQREKAAHKSGCSEGGSLLGHSVPCLEGTCDTNPQTLGG